MQIDLESINLNHDRTSDATGAFSIRKNEKINVVLPEWRKGQSFRPEDAPAAYAFKRVTKLMEKGRVSIKTEFSCDDAGVKEVLVKADDGHGKAVNVLGIVPKTAITFVKGRCDATLLLDRVRIPEVGVGAEDVIWKWQYSLDDGKNWTEITTTSHRVYTVIDMPGESWQPEERDITNTQLPWTEVLEFACRIAAPTTNPDEAATKISQWVNSLGPDFVHYDNRGNGWTGYTYQGPRRFHCTDFLLLLNTGKSPTGPWVNCDDCAAIVTTFSNILGCRLQEGKMSADKNFVLNPHIKIGQDQDDDGFFGRHNVGWLGDLTVNGRVFDACVKLDSDVKPSEEPHDFTVPTEIVFQKYRPRLTPNTTCKPRRLLPVRRIGVGARRLPVNGLDVLKILQHFHLGLPDDLNDLNLVDFRLIEVDLAEYLFQSFWEVQAQADIAFGIDMYEVGTGKSTAPLVENILDRFHLRPQRIEDTDFSEAYASEGGFTMVFVRTGFVFLVRNTGRQVIKTERLAKFIDKLFR